MMLKELHMLNKNNDNMKKSWKVGEWEVIAQILVKNTQTNYSWNPQNDQPNPTANP